MVKALDHLSRIGGPSITQIMLEGTCPEDGFDPYWRQVLEIRVGLEGVSGGRTIAKTVGSRAST